MDTEVQRYGGRSGMDLYRWVLGTLPLGGGGARGYRRLNPPVRRRVRLARLGNKKLRSLKVKGLPRLRLRLRLFRWLSPFTLLAKLQEAYVRLLQAASDKLVLYEGVSLGPSPYPSLPSHAGASPHLDLKAKDQELNRLLKLYLARTRTHLVLPHDNDDDY